MYFCKQQYFFPQKPNFLTYLERKCRLDCLYGLDSAIPPALNPLHCPTESWVITDDGCKTIALDFVLVFGNSPLFCLLGWSVTVFQTFEGMKKFGFLAEVSPISKSCPTRGTAHTAPQEEDGLQLPCEEAATYCSPPALQAGVLHIPRSYFRRTNYPKGIRHVPCHEWPLVAQGPEL